MQEIEDLVTDTNKKNISEMKSIMMEEEKHSTIKQ